MTHLSEFLLTQQRVDLFETDPFSVNPIEVLDLIGAIYLPRNGLKDSLPTIVMQQAFGWHDALQFGSESGRAELINNARFFARAFVADSRWLHELQTWQEQDPISMRQVIADGLALVDQCQERRTYDLTWPSALGLRTLNQKNLATLGEALQLSPKDLWHKTKMDLWKWYRLSPE